MYLLKNGLLVVSCAGLVNDNVIIRTPMIYNGGENFSLEVFKQEYPSYGASDYREPALQILQEVAVTFRIPYMLL